LIQFPWEESGFAGIGLQKYGSRFRLFFFECLHHQKLCCTTCKRANDLGNGHSSLADHSSGETAKKLLIPIRPHSVQVNLERGFLRQHGQHGLRL
jgi:hypothetical protein